MKKIFLGLTLVITLILPVGTNALDLTKSNETIIPNTDYVLFKVFLSYDNSGNIDGHYFYGNKLYKYNLNNELVYEKEDFEDEQIQLETVYKADNSNVKGNSDVKISSSNFEILYGGTGDEYNLDDGLLFKSYDDFGNHDGYIVFLLSTSTDLQGTESGYIQVKVDLYGNVIWQRNFEKSMIFSFENYIKTKDGKEYIYKLSDMGTSIQKYNYTGNLETIEFVKSDEMNMYPFDIKYSYNASGEIDGFIIVGVSDDHSKTVIMKYDLDLNKVFSNKIVYAFTGYQDVICSKNEKGIYDGYIIVGGTIEYQESGESGLALVQKIDFSGNTVWEDKYYFKDYNVNSLISIEENFNAETKKFNGYVLLGYSNYQGLDTEEEIEPEETAFFLKYTYPGYKITNQASNEGIISVNDEAYPGEIVKVKVSPSVGYSLKRIVVMTSSGKEVEVDSNGTFVMPDEEVTVLALYNKVSNPSTLSACYIVLGIVLLISLGTLIVTKKKEKNL